MKDLKLKNGDIFLEGDDFSSLGDNEIEETVKQRLKIRWNAFRGEWGINQNFGLPYREEILVHDPDIQEIINIFRREALDIPRVERVVISSQTFEPAKDKLSFSIGVELEPNVEEDQRTFDAQVEMNLSAGEELLLIE